MLYTLTELATYQEEIKKSRFWVFAQAVQSPADALQFFAEHKVATATHNCWAYRLGNEYRFNDDGEPGGTAGRPIFQAIEGQQCDRVAVLVVRWFGGTKLGSGGLMRAYGGTAAQCLRLASKLELVAQTIIDCHCVFSDMALVQSKFELFKIDVQTERFNEQGVVWRLSLPSSQAKAFAEQFINLTGGQGRLQIRAPEPE